MTEFLVDVITYFLSTVGMVLSTIAVFVIYFLVQERPRRKQEDEFRYVHVENNGSVRELSDEEREYLNTNFEPMDSGRPYIKSHYRAKTPDGKMHGFIERKRVPKKIVIYPAYLTEKKWKKRS